MKLKGATPALGRGRVPERSFSCPGKTIVILVREFERVDESSVRGYGDCMPSVISNTDELAGLIQPAKLAAGGFVSPKRVLVTTGTDHTGDDVYRVYLIFPDGTAERQLAWSKVKPMVQWVQDQIWKANGEQRWPYVRVAREAELPRELR